MKAIIKGQEINLNFDSKKKVLTQNNQQVDIDIKKISESSLSILLQNKSYKAELLEANYTEKQFKIRVNGNV
ncbi:MAG TPA: acetyl-CoA carboxylase biotin carboxyl carrier protein subunit, partial [Bacteroidia bacterium]|nr:acetyl-CoA carboxylase biotin carboxyl carrier protein subunit [Bacteroidia bacterium]